MSSSPSSTRSLGRSTRSNSIAAPTVAANWGDVGPSQVTIAPTPAVRTPSRRDVVRGSAARVDAGERLERSGALPASRAQGGRRIKFVVQPQQGSIQRERDGTDPWSDSHVFGPLEEEDEGRHGGSDEQEPMRRKQPNERRPQQRRRRAEGLDKRQLPYAEGYPDCNYVGNGVLSCFPEANTTLVQGVWSKFIFNAQYPTFIGAGKVDIYLYHADSETIATTYRGIETPRGMIGIQPNDQWWPNETSWNEGTNLTWPYFFVIVDANATLDGGEPHQATFRAIQTAPPSTLAASLSSATSLSSYSSSSASSASASAAAASRSSSSLSSASAAASPNPSSLQPNGGTKNDSNDLPGWAIALIVILSVLVLVLFLLAVCLVRRRRRRRTREGKVEGATPLASPSLATASSGAGGLGLTTSSEEGSERPIMRQGPARSVPVVLEGTRGRKGSGSAAGLSEDDATRITEAFRSELRKPPPVNEVGRHDSDEAVVGEGNWTPDVQKEA